MTFLMTGGGRLWPPPPKKLMAGVLGSREVGIQDVEANDCCIILIHVGFENAQKLYK